MTRSIAAFDFDGTITRRDTLAPFLLRHAGHRIAPAALRGLVGRPALAGLRDRVKRHVIRVSFSGTLVEDLERAGAAYARSLPSGYRADTLQRIDNHRRGNDVLVLVTASLGAYARPAADALGFHHVIAVELEADGNGRLTGELCGPNVRGPEKARRLQAWLDPGEEIGWAYGNSSGDREMLAMARHPRWVGRRQMTTD